MRYLLTDKRWTVLQPLAHKAKRHRGGQRPVLSERRCFKTLLYRARTGLPGRHRPGDFRACDAVSHRFRRLVVNGFGLSADEVSYFKANAADFDKLNFNALTLTHWLRLQAYTALRNSLPKVATTLLDLFQWAAKPDKPADLSAHIAAVTLWRQTSIGAMLTPQHFDLNDPGKFRNEVNLVKLQTAMTVQTKITVDVDRLFDLNHFTSFQQGV